MCFPQSVCINLIDLKKKTHIESSNDVFSFKRNLNSKFSDKFARIQSHCIVLNCLQRLWFSKNKTFLD